MIFIIQIHLNVYISWLYINESLEYQIMNSNNKQIISQFTIYFKHVIILIQYNFIARKTNQKITWTNKK